MQNSNVNTKSIENSISSINNSLNNNNNMNNEESDRENMIKLIKDQSSELKKNKKRLEKLEEKYIKTSADFKSILADKMSIENFLKIIFPKEMHENIIKAEYGLYDSSELSKFWLVCESKNQNEFQKILNQLKNENLDYVEKNKNFQIELENKIKEIKILKQSYDNLNKEFTENYSKFSETFSKYETIESEKNFLLTLVDEKNKEIEELRGLEIENAELKAKNLLENMNYNINNNENNFSSKDYSNNISNNYEEKFKNFGTRKLNKISDNENNNALKISTLNVGIQTTEELFSSEFVKNLEHQLKDSRERFDKLKKEFNEHKERSHKILLLNEENSNKIAKENEELKHKVHEINQEILKVTSNTNLLNASIILNNQANNSNLQAQKNFDHYDHLNPDFKITEINSHRISIEYLKNIILKYLEAVAIGNEFQTKILENVIFSILRIPNNDRIKLEEKRNRSSFYLNLWYNAKAFLSSKIYGNSANEASENNYHLNDFSLNNESLNFEMNKELIDMLSNKASNRETISINRSDLKNKFELNEDIINEDSKSNKKLSVDVIDNDDLDDIKI